MEANLLQKQRAETLKDDGFNAWVDKIFNHVYNMKGYGNRTEGSEADINN